MRANSLSTVTEQDFVNAVQFHYERLNKLNDIKDAMTPIFAVHVKPYIDQKLAAGEKIAILAYARRTINIVENVLEQLYPNAQVVSLIPEKTYNSTVFSNFIRKFWSQVKYLPSKSVMGIIIQMINSHIDQLVRGDVAKAMPLIQNMINKFIAENQATLTMWQTQVQNGQMTQQACLDNIKDCMLSYEIRNNAVKQALLNTKNREQKDPERIKNANFILSTIHSAKGLEFENVIGLYKNAQQMTEPDKRMYYVMLTRAMKSEFVLAYDTVASPQIQADYNTIVEKLHAKDAALAKQAAQAAMQSGEAPDLDKLQDEANAKSIADNNADNSGKEQQ